MNVIVDLFVFFGLFALLWAIIGHGSAGARAGAGLFGVLALTIAAILGAGQDDRYHRDY
jgi:hypothetical protein